MPVRSWVYALVLLGLAALPRAGQAQAPSQVGAPWPDVGPHVPAETLSQAWIAALAADRQLQAEQCNVSAARYAIQSAQAERWPLVGVEGGYTARSAEPAFKFHLEGIPLPTEAFPYAQRESFTTSARVDLPLYTSGRIRYRIAAAEAELASATLDAEDAVMDLKMRVAEAYVTVLRAQRDVQLTDCSVQTLEAHKRDVELFFKWERVRQNDLLAAHVALGNARYADIQARNQLDIARAAYNRQLGRPLAAAVRIAELPLETPEGELEGWTSRALRARPTIARLATRAQALEHQAQSVRAKNGPQVSARGEFAYAENRFQTPNGIAAAGVGVSWNLLDGGRNRYEAAALLQRAEALRHRQADLESAIALEVRRAWLDVQETRQRLGITPEAIQQAEENLRVARKRYSLGTATHTEVLEAETLRTQAYRNHQSALYDAVLAALRLRYSTGELK